MQRREFLAATLAASLFTSANLKNVFAEDGKKKKLLYYERSTSYVHPSTVIDPATGLSVTGRVLKKLGAELGYEVVCTKDGRVFDGDLDQYDGFILYCCGVLTGQNGEKDTYPLSKEGEQRFYEAVRAGKGVLGFHSASDTNHSGGPSRFENAEEARRNDYTKMLGGEFIVHGSQQVTTLNLLDVDKEFPSHKPFGDTISCKEEWYTLRNFNPDIHVLMVQDTKEMKVVGHDECYDRPPYPCTWARMEGKGRVAFTSLAHNNSTWDEEWMQAVVLDLLKFITGSLNYDLTPNIKTTAPGAYTLKR